MKSSSLSLICGGSLCLLAAVASAQTTTILNETWADGDRSNQNLPNSSAWFNPGHDGTLTSTTGSMTSTSSSTRYTLTYFTSPVGGNAPVPVTVDKGQVLTLSYSYSFTGISTTGTPWLRIGLFDSTTGTNSIQRISQDAQPTDQGTTLNNPIYKGYTGYMFDESNLRTGGGVNLRRRNSSTSLNLMTANGSYTGTIGSSVSGVAYQNSTIDNLYIYNAVITVAHSENELGEDIVILTQNVYDAQNNLLFSRTGTDTDGTWQFDTLAFAATGLVGSMTLYDVNITLGQIPEPSTVAAIGAGVALLVCLGLRRRQHGKAGANQAG